MRRKDRDWREGGGGETVSEDGWMEVGREGGGWETVSEEGWMDGGETVSEEGWMDGWMGVEGRLCEEGGKDGWRDGCRGKV